MQAGESFFRVQCIAWGSPFSRWSIGIGAK